METNTPTSLGILLKDATDNIALHDQADKIVSSEQTLHVQDMGNGLLFVYEQLRNVSENIENHLIFQSAIRRFYKRSLSFGFNKDPQGLAQELVIELTQAEYLKNDSTPLSKLAAIDTYINEHYRTYWYLIKHYKSVRPEIAQKWMLDILTVKTEQAFNNPVRLLSFAAFAYSHFSQLIKVSDFLVEGEKVDEADYSTVLYIAIHKALLKSNDANVRSGLFGLYGISNDNVEHLVEFNKKFDYLSSLKTTAKLSRTISRNGAPLRILRATFFSKNTQINGLRIDNRSHILGQVEAQITEEYGQVQKTVRAGVIKSIIFLLITKALIGLIVEIPYDLAVTGAIVVFPLVINLIFPPVFIAFTALTFKMPSNANKKAIVDYIETMLYQVGNEKPQLKYFQVSGRSYFFNVVYAIMFVGVFYLLAKELLFDLHFNIVQAFIFFGFLSTASFLGYRLTLQIKELEIVSRNQGFIALIRDFLYAPFIFVGRKISYRFARMNIIAQLLDIVIELPLKTVLRMMRQWSTFLNNKKDELL
ncbi:MAG: rane protein of unknown function [Candidatus Saccharibacteria bacterium]|nr:rane protein of unknown function [Candidatus Saccharibacteria bacterium]